MDCSTAHDAILDQLATGAPVNVTVEAHLATCAECARFALRQRALDDQLASALVAPALSASFRATLRARIRSERRRAWLDVAPDIVHFTSCGVATAVCAVLVPANTTVIVAAGATAALVAYIALATLRTSLDDAD